MAPEKPIDSGAKTSKDRCPWVPPHRHPHGHWRSPYWDRVHWKRPPRHWFFMKILMLFFWVCVALTISFFVSGSLPSHRIFDIIGIVFLVMFLGGMVLRRMFGPLRMLMRGVQEISEGNLDFQFPVHGRHGEINYLSEQFNQMVGHIKEMIQSKERLLLDVSHELRSPLTRLKVALEMSPKGKMRDSMLQDVAEMEAMLNEILETQRLRNGNGKLSLERFDLATLTREILERYEGHPPGVVLVGTSGKWDVMADRARIRTVLQNVLENALKYSTNQKKPVEISFQPVAEGFQVIIQDFGMGIPHEEQERVFEPFYRVDKSRTKETGGYGLGLSLCREIMLAHGGDIHLRSNPGEGTQVVLSFPVEPVQSPTETAAKKP